MRVREMAYRAVQIRTFLGFGDLFQLGRLLERPIVEAGNLVENLERLLRLVLDLLFGQLLIVETARSP